jgi:hypothetical protein
LKSYVVVDAVSDDEVVDQVNIEGSPNFIKRVNKMYNQRLQELP